MTELIKPSDKMTTIELTQKLQQFYEAKKGAWSFITQIRNGTGWNQVTRTADAMAMGLWPSTGLELIGFELKVSRSDWLHELKQPEKAEEMKQFCDRWYLVVPDESIVKPGELPEGWGLMVASGRGRTIKEKIKAPELTPVDVDRLLLASIFRNVTERCVPLEIHRDAVKRAEEWGVEKAERRTVDRLKRADELERKIKEFEEISGLPFPNWGDEHKDLAEVVKKAKDGRYDKADEALEKIAQRAEKLAEYARGGDVYFHQI